MKLLFAHFVTQKTPTKLVYVIEEAKNYANEQIKNATEQYNKTIGETKDKLGAMDYGIAIMEAQKNREKLSQNTSPELEKKLNEATQSVEEFQKRHAEFANAVRSKLNQKYPTLLQRFGTSVEKLKTDMPLWTEQKKAEFKNAFQDFVQSDIVQDPGISKIWESATNALKNQKMFGVSNTNVKIGVGVGTFQFLRGKSFQESSIAAAWSVIALQPIVFDIASGAINYIPPALQKIGNGIGNLAMGAANGELLDEILSVNGGDGNPLAYALDGSTKKDRKFENLKDVDRLQNANKHREYMNPTLQGFYQSFDTYDAKKPETQKDVQKNIGEMADFSAMVSKMKFEPGEMAYTIQKMRNNEWDEKGVKKLMTISTMGGIIQFFKEKASPTDRKKFFDSMATSLAKKNKKSIDFSKKDLDKILPGVEQISDPKEQGKVMKMLSNPLSMGFGIFILTNLLSKFVLRGFLEASEDGGSGLVRASKKIFKSFKTKSLWITTPLFYPIATVKKFINAKRLGSQLNELENAKDDQDHGLFFIGKEKKNIKKLKRGPKVEIRKDIKQFFKDRKKSADLKGVAMSRKEFWELPSVKKYAADLNEASSISKEDES